MSRKLRRRIAFVLAVLIITMFIVILLYTAFCDVELFGTHRRNICPPEQRAGSAQQR